MRKAKLSKIYKITAQRWNDDWDKLYDFYNRTPYTFKVLMSEEKEQEILQPLWNASEAVKKETDATILAYTKELMAELELDHDAWDKWTDEINDEKYFPDEGHPDFGKTPDKIPSPPQDPREALWIIKRWEYPETIEGLVQKHIAFHVLLADAIESHKKRLAWS